METGSVEVAPKAAAAGGGGGGGGLSLRKIYAAIPLIPIVILSIIVIGLTGSSYQILFDPTVDLKGNAATVALLSYTAPAATLAIAAAVSGLWYSIEKGESGARAGSASALALVAWAMALVAFGFACKQTNLGLPGVGLDGRLKGLAAMTILLFIFETLYVVVLHLL